MDKSGNKGGGAFSLKLKDTGTYRSNKDMELVGGKDDRHTTCV